MNTHNGCGKRVAYKAAVNSWQVADVVKNQINRIVLNGLHRSLQIHSIGSLECYVGTGVKVFHHTAVLFADADVIEILGKRSVKKKKREKEKQWFHKANLSDT